MTIRGRDPIPSPCSALVSLKLRLGCTGVGGVYDAYGLLKTLDGGGGGGGEGGGGGGGCFDSENICIPALQMETAYASCHLPVFPARCLPVLIVSCSQTAQTLFQHKDCIYYYYHCYGFQNDLFPAYFLFFPFDQQPFYQRF